VCAQVLTGYNGVKALPYVEWLEGINSAEKQNLINFLEVAELKHVHTL
jgi:hypothetical protein